MKHTLILTTGAIALLNSAATAQYGYGSYPYGGIYQGGYGGGTTAQSANEMGMAALIRAEGMYEKDHVEAVTKWNESVRQLSIERLQQRNAYLDMMHKKAIADGHANRERLDARKQAALARRSGDQYPDALHPSEFDPESGKINWPVLFQRELFTQTRTATESQINDWLSSKKTGHSFDIYGVHASVDHIRSELKTLITTVPTGEYLAARNFLDRLDQTIQLNIALPPRANN